MFALRFNTTDCRSNLQHFAVREVIAFRPIAGMTAGHNVVHRVIAARVNAVQATTGLVQRMAAIVAGLLDKFGVVFKGNQELAVGLFSTRNRSRVPTTWALRSSFRLFRKACFAPRFNILHSGVVCRAEFRERLCLLARRALSAVGCPAFNAKAVRRIFKQSSVKCPLATPATSWLLEQLLQPYRINTRFAIARESSACARVFIKHLHRKNLIAFSASLVPSKAICANLVKTVEGCFYLSTANTDSLTATPFLASPFRDTLDAYAPDSACSRVVKVCHWLYSIARSASTPLSFAFAAFSRVLRKLQTIGCLATSCACAVATAIFAKCAIRARVSVPQSVSRTFCKHGDVFHRLANATSATFAPAILAGSRKLFELRNWLCFTANIARFGLDSRHPVSSSRKAGSPTFILQLVTNSH